jgi:hypothetical protein
VERLTNKKRPRATRFTEIGITNGKSRQPDAGHRPREAVPACKVIDHNLMNFQVSKVVIVFIFHEGGNVFQHHKRIPAMASMAKFLASLPIIHGHHRRADTDIRLQWPKSLAILKAMATDNM